MLHRPTRLLTGLVVLAAVASCSHHKKAAAAASSPSPSPSPSPTAAPFPPGGELTGLAGPTGPVLAIKVDNSGGARPLQKGLDKAQLVYQEVVEGGATRFMGIFVGPQTTDIGPVRSARDTDIDLLKEYGKVIFAFSGANDRVLGHVDRANLIDVSHDTKHPEAYDTRGRRPEAYNFFTNPDRLIKAAGSAGKATRLRDVGLRFAAAAPSGGRPVTGRAVATFTPYSHDTITWDARAKVWRIVQDGQPVKMAGVPVGPVNIIVQFVPLSRGRYADVLGNNSPDTRSDGTGKAWVLRDGQAFAGTWSRPKPLDGTHFLDATGKDLPLHPGRSFILLVPNNTKLVLS